MRYKSCILTISGDASARKRLGEFVQYDSSYLPYDASTGVVQKMDVAISRKPFGDRRNILYTTSGLNVDSDGYADGMADCQTIESTGAEDNAKITIADKNTQEWRWGARQMWGNASLTVKGMEGKDIFVLPNSSPIDMDGNLYLYFMGVDRNESGRAGANRVDVQGGDMYFGYKVRDHARYYSILAADVAAGDFNGDGYKNEILLAYADNGGVAATIFTVNSTDGKTLTVTHNYYISLFLTTQGWGTDHAHQPSLAALTGDFDGDGREEVAFVTQTNGLNLEYNFSIMKTYCFKLYHCDHNYALMRQINIAALIYNHCVALHRRYYRLYGKYLQPCKLMKHLTKLKRTKRFAYIRKLGSQAVQNIAERIDRAYNLFWSNLKRRVKTSPPKFKALRRYKSFTLKQTGWSLDEKTGRIRIGKKWYGYFQSRLIEGKVKTVTVKRDAVGDIYVYLVCDVQCDPVEARTGKIVGFDFGLKIFLTGSDGHDIESPDFFKQNAKYIKVKCRKLSHKQKGAHNRERARLDLARAYRRMENQRHDFHFKLARRLCEEYACICLETLNLKGMARLWGRKIHSLGFAEFVKILEYEALKFGTQVVFVPKFFPSSQQRSVCGYKNSAVKDLKVREWNCPNCGVHHDRDRNAARNIHMAGASAISGDTVRPEQ